MVNLNNDTITLGLDTSCDETSASVVRGYTILSNVLPSQMEYHRKYGGVVPSLARLAHEQRINHVVSEAVKRSRIDINDINFIAVTQGPGLAIALEVGIKKAKELSGKHKIPLIAVNHMEGHLLSPLARRNSQKAQSYNISPEFPVVGLLVSGGHTELILINTFGDYQKIGETIDDACGEAYDKCGRMLGLGYPGGPVITQFAKQHRKNMKLEFAKKHKSSVIIGKNKKSGFTYELPVSMLRSGDLNFSYSGLKTAMRYKINDLIGRNITKEDEMLEKIKGLDKEQIFDLCVIFEEAAITQLVKKLKMAISMFGPKEVWLGGGVVASARLRHKVRRIIRLSGKKIVLRYPYSNKLTGDNAAMIALAANIRVSQLGGTERVYSQLKKDGSSLKDRKVFTNNLYDLDREPNLTL